MSAGSLQVRWSEHEARKPYARPFAVRFLTASGDILGSVAVSGADLLYLRQFQTAVLALTGELFTDPRIASEADPQAAWLDWLATLLSVTHAFSAEPESTFDDAQGRLFRFRLRTDAGGECVVGAEVLADYQELQAAIAHQTGTLYRDPSIECIAAPSERQAAWWLLLQASVSRPSRDDAMAEAWPWR